MSKKQEKPSVDNILAFTGLFVNVAAVTYSLAYPSDMPMSSKRWVIGAAIFGLLINQLGSWHVASQLFANRKYHSLRAEVARFIGLVQRLNSATLTHDIEVVDHTRQEMYKAVDRMVVAAGVTRSRKGGVEGSSQPRTST